MNKQLSGLNVLIVEDELELRTILKEILVAEGFNVLLADGGIAAIDEIKKNRIDVVISDVKMPKGDGIKLLNDIQSMELPRPAVIMMTGFSDLTKQKAMQLGAIGLLSKPFMPEDLTTLLEKYLSKTT